MIEADNWGETLWAFYDSEREAKRARPAPTDDGFPSATSTTTAQALDVVTITDPAKYAASALERGKAELEGAPHGERNHTLNAVAFSLGRLVAAELLDYDSTAEFLEGVADEIWPDRDRHNVRGTITSGLRGGEREPLNWLQGAASSYDPASPFGTVGGQVGTSPAAVPTSDPFGTAPQPAAAPQAITAEMRAGLLLQQEMSTQRARREAKRLLDHEEAAASFRIPPSRLSLLDELRIPETPITYGIEELLPAGGNALLTAQFKAGKTSTVNNLVRAHCDGTPFLGKYAVNPAPGRIAVFNYEVGDDLYRRWLRELQIENPDRACVLHLRGFRLPVTVPSVEDWVVQWLQDHEVSTWIVDPFARAFTGCGDNENDNGQVGVFLDTLDVIKARAGVRDLVLPTHTGRAEQEQGQERSRGATRLEDWADVRWLLTQVDGEDEGPPQRFFRATGRDVEVPEGLLTWNPDDRSQTHSGGDRKWAKERVMQQRILDFLTANPAAAKRAVLEGVTGKDAEIGRALNQLVGSRHARCEKAAGRGLADAYFANKARVLAGPVTSPTADLLAESSPFGDVA